MNLRDLEYFVAVAELGHFHGAAERCFVSQPTLSGQLRKLEEELGHMLFDRDTRNVKLTSFGREALPLAKGALEQVAALVRKAKELQDPFCGPVHLGAFPTLGPWLFPRVGVMFAKSFAQSEFFLTEEKSSLLQQKIQDGSLDAAFLALPQRLPGVQVEPVFSESFLLCVSGGHAWKSRKGIVASELSGLELILLEDGHCLRDQALDLCMRYGARERGHFRATGLETLRQMVRLGTGMTLIPRLAIPDHKDAGIHYLPIRNPEPMRQIALCFRETHPRKALFLAMAEAVRGACGDGLPVESIGGSLASRVG